MPLVGWILIIVAALCVASVLFVVVREHVETEEWYIPPQGGSSSERLGHLDTISSAGTSEIIDIPPASDADDAEHQIEENR